MSRADELPPERRQLLIKTLEPLNRQYDPREKMVESPFHSPGYHTVYKGATIHSTRESLRYAAALLDTGEPELRQQAFDILRRVIALQDQDPKSRTFGIWSWFLEEPLSQMSPPDFNWADFCGRDLLRVKLHHDAELPADLRARLDNSIKDAAESIRRRNVGPAYTNIAILGTYVTLVTAETYNLPDLHDYATARLKRFYDYTMEQGAFSEYNSPTYTLVSLEALAQLKADVKDPAARPMIDELHRLTWQEIATHFHAPTRQWSGPHSRCYQTLLLPSTLLHIQRATNGRVDFGVAQDTLDLESYREPLDCPKEFDAFFTTLEAPRTVVETFVKGSRPTIGTTYLHPQFSLGSVNRADLWNQRRPFVAYWGTAKEPAYLVVRFLRDGYDFAAAQFFSAQKEGLVVAAIDFATDGGNTHVSLDRLKNGQFTAKDLRLRFELGGAAKDLTPIATSTTSAQLALPGNLKLALHVPYARMGDMTARQTLSPSAADYVFYSGPEKSFSLESMNEAAIAFMAQFLPESREPANAHPLVSDGRVGLNVDGISVAAGLKPDRIASLLAAGASSVAQPQQADELLKPKGANRIATSPAAQAGDPPVWFEPFPAHRIVGNLYYVGSKDLGTYLIATPQGHILINSGFDRTVQQIQKSVESLGFKLSDVKYLLASHSHSDHVAGMAKLKQLTGAKVLIMHGDDQVISSGGKGQYLYTNSRWTPCPVDQVLSDKDQIKLGDITLAARLTPGHTRGCTTWTFDVTDSGKIYHVVIIGSPNVNPGYRLVNNPAYPTIAEDFATTFAVLKSLPCDIFLGAHGAYYGMVEKYARIKSDPATNPFVDPDGYKKFVAEKEAAFRQTLSAQERESR
jgi:glyoxylase-like metal-dependent hydrolase (beta-lactamase superfamily II)